MKYRFEFLLTILLACFVGLTVYNIKLFKQRESLLRHFSAVQLNKRLANFVEKYTNRGIDMDVLLQRMQGLYCSQELAVKIEKKRVNDRIYFVLLSKDDSILDNYFVLLETLQKTGDLAAFRVEDFCLGVGCKKTLHLSLSLR